MAPVWPLGADGGVVWVVRGSGDGIVARFRPSPWPATAPRGSGGVVAGWHPSGDCRTRRGGAGVGSGGRSPGSHPDQLRRPRDSGWMVVGWRLSGHCRCRRDRSDSQTLPEPGCFPAPSKRRFRWSFRRSREVNSVPIGDALGERSDGIQALAFSPDGSLIASGHNSGCVTLKAARPGSSEPIKRLMGLRDSGWATLYGEHRYELHGDPERRFWWTAGMCRFEPGELDDHGIERL